MGDAEQPLVQDVIVKPSSVEGLGVFAARGFVPGERIRRVNIVREVTAETPIREDAGERIEHCSYPDGKVVLWGYPDRHVNHRCDPNAYALEEGDGSEVVYIVARRTISAGEEITFDYNINISRGSSWLCNCGAERCLGETVGDYFRLPLDRRIEYLPLLAGWFVAKHRAQIEALREPL